MKISLNCIKKYVKIPESVSESELIDLIGSRLVEIEEVIDLRPKYEGIYIAKVVECEPIPETHLSLCQIDVGDIREDLKGDNGLIQVVCGAQNVHAGMLAVWIMPGAIVPETFGNENFKLGVRKLRGYESNGMLAGADELDLDTEHKAIAEIDPKMASAGDEFAKIFDLNDLILDVENKSLTHRPDCFGLIGFAREVAGILGVAFEEPDVFRDLSVESPSVSSELTVKIADSELCPRYSCAVFDLPKHTPSKYLNPSAVFLAKAGMRSIDPMVDLTNILMLETGQPLHAFDYDKLIKIGGTDTPEIIVRAAREKEELQLLDGKVIQCIPDDILITSNNIPVALAGAMGGKNTEIDPSTTRVVLESATFSLYHLRKTQMAHGIFSEAITRFTKGQPAGMTLAVLDEAIRRLNVEPSAVVDEYPGKLPKATIKITTDEINQLLGSSYDVNTIIKTLKNVDFETRSLADHSFQESPRPTGSGRSEQAPRNDGRARACPERMTQQDSTLEVTAPLWRTDIHIKEDVIEEVGRLLGYDNIPLTLPEKPFTGTSIDEMIKLKTELREILSDRLCMNELLTYSFVSRQLIEKSGQDPAESYEITNSISPELQCFRQQIVPSLLDKARENLKSGHSDFTLYEMNQVTHRSSGLTEENVPKMKTHLGIVNVGDFYNLKAKVLALFRDLHLPVEYRALSKSSAQAEPYLEPKRSAELIIGDQKIGAFGELRRSVAAKFKFDLTISALELCLDRIVNLPRETTINLRLSKFPSVDRDITLQVSTDATFGRIGQTLTQSLAAQGLYYTVTPVSIYQPESTSPTKNLSFHLRFASPDKTLNSTEISAIMETIARDVAAVGATII